MIQKKIEKPNAKYNCTLSRDFNVNMAGWKLAHIEPVGLRSNAAIESIPLERLLIQFSNLMAPANMFVVPLNWGGIAENETVIQAMAAAVSGRRNEGG